MGKRPSFGSNKCSNRKTAQCKPTHEADRIFDRYRGKWLRVSGFIDNIQSVSAQKSMLTFQNPYVAMFFDGKKQADRVSVLQKGERVTAIGKIAKAGPTSVRLDECEIESR